MKQRPPIKLCPVCQTAMVASKSQDAAGSRDIFRCLKCEAVIERVAPPKTIKEN
jgi:DNA-directed RNA polymerase subunit M/transcription elongation factor TFIIS